MLVCSEKMSCLSSTPLKIYFSHRKKQLDKVFALWYTCIIELDKTMHIKEQPITRLTVPQLVRGATEQQLSTLDFWHTYDENLINSWIINHLEHSIPITTNEENFFRQLLLRSAAMHNVLPQLKAIVEAEVIKLAKGFSEL